MVLTRQGLRFAGRLFPCSIGRGGVTTRKREGDGCTPAGIHGIVGCLYRPDRMARPVDWACPSARATCGPTTRATPDYNLMVRAPHPFGHERLRRPDPLYDLVLLTDWNWPRAVKGRGSAIFLHRWRRPGHPTAGCVALAPQDLAWIVSRLRHGVRLIVPETLA